MGNIEQKYKPTEEDVKRNIDATEAIKKSKKFPLYPVEDRGDYLYKMFWNEVKETGDYLNVFICLSKDVQGNKTIMKALEEAKHSLDFLEDLAKKHEIPKFFHNPKGPAYGAIYYNPETRQEKMPHGEYWLNGKRLMEEDEIKRLIFDSAFAKKAEALIQAE